MTRTSTLALIATLTACSAEVVYYPPVGTDAGPGGAGGQGGSIGGQGGTGGCLLQADCDVGDGVHDICYEYKSVPLTTCVDGSSLPCTGHEHCEPFGWCDPALGACQAEGASTCLVGWQLVNCADSGEVCCETADGMHGCSADCEGTVLEP